MSEEILKALMQLFAILTKQEGGPSDTQRTFVSNFLNQQLSPDMVPEYIELFEKKSKGKKAKAEKEEEATSDIPEDETEEQREKRLRREERRKARAAKKAAEAEAAGEEDGRTSMVDSVKTLAICKKINKTLAQKQKVIAFVRLLELIWVDRSLNPNAKELMDTVADVFNISKEEYQDISFLTLTEDVQTINSSNLLVVDNAPAEWEDKETHHIEYSTLAGKVIFLKVPSVELYFVKVFGNSNLYMNGLPLITGQVYLFPPGSTVKLPSGKPIYYSDVIAKFLSDSIDLELSFNANNLEYKFPNGGIGLRDINISEDTGKLVGIMGASGAGKSTLLNVLNGNEIPSKGEVKINGIDIHKERDKVEGVIGYVPQDDLLIEELTVYENLFYNAKLCLSDLSDEEIEERIIQLLKNLDLLQTKDLKVGNPLEKTISGGQRKRLNIGLELLREPAIIFMDEPTSGLSSRDSENIMDLLKELVLKGKIIFVVIHQPSSDIYKMFDKMVILDVGGYQIYYGNPVEAIMHFKRRANQVNSESGECPTCGNVNPELIFNIIDAKLVDDYGKFLDDRKVSPVKWNEFFKEDIEIEKVEDASDQPPNSLKIPSKLGQWFTFIKRDVLSKVKNKQYMYLNMLEAPALAFVLAFIVRYTAGEGEYHFFNNQNFPAYVFMSIVVALFMGLMVSAEEIIKDAKILKREKFLNLSKGSYLFSKVSILFTISAIQSLLFVLIGNAIIGFHEMWFSHWMVLFSTACFANVLGLNISQSFNSVVTIYILIPLILIPQMVLSGAMFSFDRINGVLGGGKNKVPAIAEIMVSRWAYEAMIVKQFKENSFEGEFYNVDKRLSQLDFIQAHYIGKLKGDLDYMLMNMFEEDDSLKAIVSDKFTTVQNEILYQVQTIDTINVEGIRAATPETMDDLTVMEMLEAVESINAFYSEHFNQAMKEKESILAKMMDDEVSINDKKFAYANEFLSDLVKKVGNSEYIEEDGNRLVRLSEPIYMDPKTNFKAHFYAPVKYVFGKKVTTFSFNIAVIWLMSLILYVTLYFETFKKLMNISKKS